MKKLRWKILQLLFFVLLLVGGVLGLQLYVQARTEQLHNAELKELVDLQEDYQLKLQTPVVLKNLNQQPIDQYIFNLNHQVDLLKAEIAVAMKKHELSESDSERDQLLLQTQKAKDSLNRFLLDKAFMRYASVSWSLILTRPEIKDYFKELSIAEAEASWPEPDAEGDIFIDKGQIIGGQGCSGVCTGTHLHFVVLKDRVEQDPCSMLPKRQLIRWGVLGECGIDASETATEISWPMRFGWIISQKFGKKSPITGTKHLGIDLIDNDGSPIVAAHSGWYYSIRRSCTGAYICKGGSARIAIVCEHKGCETGLVSEYWHLSWFMKSSADSKDIPISEFD